MLWKQPKNNQEDALKMSYDMVKYERKGDHSSPRPPTPPTLEWLSVPGSDHDFSLNLPF